MKKIYFIGLAITAFLIFERYVFIFPSVSLPWVVKDLFFGLVFAHLYFAAAYILMVIPRAIFSKQFAESVFALNWIIYTAVVLFGITYYLQNVQLIDKSFMLIYGVPMIIMGGILEKVVYLHNQKENDQEDTKPSTHAWYDRDLLDGKDHIIR